MKVFALLLVSALACSTSRPAGGDAAAQPALSDALAQLASDTAPAVAIDFSVEGCPDLDPDTLSCTGPAPLALRFVPLSTAQIESYAWSFGAVPAITDLTPTPLYTYELPGTYSVTLVATTAAGSLVTKSRDGFVTVTADTIGDPCNLDGQCASPLTCLCPASTPATPSSGGACQYGPPEGSCTGSCPAGTCGPGQTCANLAPASGGAIAVWQAELCLRQCATDSDCGAELRCRVLPGPDGISWVDGCFGDYPADVGHSCVDASGELRGDLCTGGVCANLGLMGMCTMVCSERTCAPGSSCAVLGDGRELCLEPCPTGSECTADPLLGCVGPGPGDLGYHLTAASPGLAQTYCAPRPCASNADCAPSGSCDGQSNGHCVAQSP